MRSFPLDGVMVTPMLSQYPREVYRVTNPVDPKVVTDVTVAFDLADPQMRVLDVLRKVISTKLLTLAKTEPSWKLALQHLVVAQ